jgi:polar amino acid transport system substrate-binding protein
MGNMLSKNGVAVHFAIGDTSVFVRGSFQRLEQVVINLIQNSCDAVFNSAIRSIFISIDSTHPDAIHLCIRDTGCGIAPQDLPHITDPFFTTKRTYGGTGLGLSVSTKIVADHAGKLQFESEVGKGTSAILILPKKRE